MDETADLLIVGGGVNGAGIARDAAGRGLSVVLCEKSDLASATSSASTKLIHGGLRYLEHYDFGLVRKALLEREVLLRMAPHIIWPLRFVLPHHDGLRPAALLRLGLFIYDHLAARRSLPPTAKLALDEHPAGAPLRAQYRLGFEYSDCWVEDSRLVILNAVDAAERGARVLTRTAVTGARREGGLWRVDLHCADGARRRLRARALVNATGPWIGEMGKRLGGGDSAASAVRLVKGSHIVTRRLFPGDHAYLFQNADGRIAFAIPYERDFTLVGTTETSAQEEPDRVAPSHEEVRYLCSLVNDYLERPVQASDVVSSFAGVRPLYEDRSASASAVTREYVLELDGGAGTAPRLDVIGGKITTYRRLAEDVVARLQPLLGHRGRPWTAAAPLPGGDMPDGDFDAFAAAAARRYPWVPASTLQRLLRAYGTRVERILAGAASMQDLGRDFGRHLTEAEVDYLRRCEWARSAEDVLWRRSRLGLHLPARADADLDAWLGAADAGPGDAAAAPG